MARAQHQEILSVSAEALFHVITAYENYPQFVDNCSSVKVDRSQKDFILVDYKVELLSREIQYQLRHFETAEIFQVSWELENSTFLKKNTGFWQLQPLSDGRSQAVYSIEIEFKIPVPSFILNKVVKSNLPSMVQSFARLAKST